MTQHEVLGEYQARSKRLEHLGAEGVIITVVRLAADKDESIANYCQALIALDDGQKVSGVCEAPDSSADLAGLRVRATVRLRHVNEDDGYRHYHLVWVIM